MARPVVSPLAEEVYADLEPVGALDESVGWHLLIFLEAIARMYARPEGAFRSVNGRPAGSQILDVDNAPAWLVPWLAQFVGWRVRSGSSDAEARTQIRDEQNFKRGRTDTMVAAVQATLDPGSTRYVALLERVGGDAYREQVTVRSAQVLDAGVTLAAAMKAKAGGLILTLLSTASPTYGEWEATWAGNTYRNAETAFATYAAAEAA